MKYSSLEVDIPTKGIARENEDRNIDSDETNQMENYHRFTPGGSFFVGEFCFHRYHL